MVQDTYQNGVGSALFVSGVLSNSALAYICVVYSGCPRPGRGRSAWVCPGQSQLAGSPRFSQILPGSPRFSQEISDFLRFCGFPGFPGRTWVLFSAILWDFRGFLGEAGCYFLRFCGFPGFPGRTWVLFSALLWGFRDFLGEPGWKQLGMGLGELQEFVRGKLAGGWPAILTRNF